MKFHLRYSFSIAAVILVCFLWSGFASATMIAIDQFSISKNSSMIFDDQFDDGNPPPSAPNYIISGGTANYGVYPNSATGGTESGGLFQFDTTQGGLINSSVAGNPLIWQSYRLQTNRTQGLTRGLRSDDDLIVNGLFNFSEPALKEAYGIRLVDYGTYDTNGPDDVLMLELKKTSSGDVKIRFRQADFANGIFNTLDSYTLSSQNISIYDQILFSLTTDGLANPSSDSVTASFTLYDFEDAGNNINHSFTTTGSIFNGEDFTRAEFFARAPVPIPSTIVLMLAGLAGLAGIRRKFK